MAKPSVTWSNMEVHKAMLSPIKMHKANKYAMNMRELPESARTFFMQSFGCARKVYNLYVDHVYGVLDKVGYTCGDDIPEVKLPEVTVFKGEYKYLKDVDSLALANVKVNFERAWHGFVEQGDHTQYTKRALKRAKSGTEPLTFRGLKGMPKFQAKARGDFSYTTNCQHPTEGNGLKNPTIRLNGNMLHLPKLKVDVPLILHRPMPKDSMIGNVTVSMDTDGQMYASIEYTYTLMMEMDIRNAVMGKDQGIVDTLSFLGLDYDQKDFYVDSKGGKANYPHYYRKSEEKLAKLQRRLSRMERGSSNYKKELARIQRLHTKIKNQRLDFICQEVAYLARTYDVVVVEDIDLRAMSGALSLGKNLHDNGFGVFRTRLQQKLEAKGSVLVKIDRWYPSSKTCHCCKFHNKDVINGVYEWTCPKCGTHHDRDHNAAINICEEGKRIFIEYFADWLDQKAKTDKRLQVLSESRKHKKSKKDNRTASAA